MSGYEEDILVWSERQGALLRRLAKGERVNDADLDWENIAEEVESVGRSQLSAVRSLLIRTLEHRLKVQVGRTLRRCICGERKRSGFKRRPLKRSRTRCGSISILPSFAPVRSANCRR